MKNKKFWLTLLTPVLLVSFLLSGCAKSGGENEAITDVRQLDGQAIGVLTGSSLDVLTDELIEDADKQYYDKVPDLALAVEQGNTI